MLTFLFISYGADYLPAEEVALATIYRRGPKEGEAKRVWSGGPRALSVKSYCPFTPCLRTPADCWIVLHKCLKIKGKEVWKSNGNSSIIEHYMFQGITLTLY